jgi:protein-disulfide isomerase
MRSRQVWFAAVVVMMLLLAACGPQMATPTVGTTPGAIVPTDSTTTTTSPTASQVSNPETLSPAELPVSEDDWRVLGSPDAPVTIVEYSDFQ